MDLINRAANIPNIARSADSRVPSDLSHKVIICHPGYGDAADDLISFAAFDRLHGGLYYDTALIACGIISGNHWDGFFSKDIDGEKIISFASCDGILSPGSYYFQLPGLCGKPFPVVPSFRQWQFPHRNLPPSWTSTSYTPGSFTVPTGARSDISLQLFFRDNGKCRMSYHEEGCEKAHLCPREENQWFHQQRMDRYIRGMGKTGDLAVDDVNNRVLLRADLHKTFDDNKFVFVPKNGEFVVHMLEPSSELTAIYHKTRLHSLNFVPREYLFARFAWSLFPFIEGFLQASKDRLLLSVNSTQPHLATAEQCMAMGSKQESRARSPKKKSSPTKRPRTEPNENDLKRENNHLSHHQQEKNFSKRIKIVGRVPDDYPSQTSGGSLGDEYNLQPTSKSTEDEAVNHPRIQTAKRRPFCMDLPLSPKSLPLPDITPSTMFSALQSGIGYGNTGLALAPSTPRTHASSQSISDPMLEVDENLRMRQIRYEALLRERERSDKDGVWQEELDWADEYLGKTAADMDGMRRLWWIYGFDGGNDSR